MMSVDVYVWMSVDVSFITPRAHARSGVKQSVLSISQSVSSVVCLSVCQAKKN